MSRKSRRNKFLKSGQRKKQSSKRTNKRAGLANSYESLEARRLLAFTFGFDGTTLTLDQSVDDGSITIDNNGGGDAFQATDGSGTVTYSAATNLVVNLLDGTGNQFDLQLDNAHNGDVELNLGDGARSANFTGSSNAIAGSLAVTAGSDNQTVEVAIAANFSVGANATFDLGAGYDTVDENANDVAISSNLTLVGVNEFENNGTMAIGGNVTMDVSAETETTRFDDDNEMAIGGDFTFTGGDGRDEVLLNDTGVTNIGGNVMVDLADNTVGGTQFMWWNSADTTISGNVTVLSTSAANPDDVQDIAGATVGGDILIDLGDGQNEADLLGTFNGSTADYTGGSGVDEVVYDMSGSLADVTVTLGQGDDSFVLGPNVTIAPTTLTVDFGNNNDTYTNNFGNYTFNTLLLGIDGFNYDYNVVTDSLVATQVAAAPGMVTVDNNGTANAIRVTNSVTTEITPATNLTVNLLEAISNLDVYLDSALAGDLEINLVGGDRTLAFHGTDNSIGGNLTVNGGLGEQLVYIAVNNTLTVGGDLLFDLGLGVDVVDEDNNDISVAGNWDFIGVNRFENGGTMTVGGNVTIDSTGELEDTVFDDDATMTINGDYTYMGGDGRDESTMNGVAGGTSILGNAYVDVGDNTVGGVQFIFFNLPNASVGGTLDVISTASANIDSFSLHPSASVGGDIHVDLGDGTNDAGFSGVFGGNDVRYDGGDGTDTVFYGMTGNPADVNIVLGAGDDTFSLGAGASIAPTTLRVDYGGGVDNFINGYGDFDFNASFLNLDGFNRFYNDALDQWDIHQIVNSGDVTVDNNGVANAIQLTNNYTTSMSPAATIRLTMFSDTGNVDVDLDSPLAGDLILNLFDGDRNVNFTGTSNTIGGNLFVEANDGVQNVNLAVNNQLTVGESAVVNVRGDVDTVSEAGNGVTVADSLIFRGVNDFENLGTLNAGSMLMNTSFEVEQARLDNDGTMNILDSLIYIGGMSKDDIILNDGVTVGGNVSLDVGNNLDEMPAQNINLNGFHGMGSVTVIGGDSFGGNSLVTDATTVMDDNFIVNFTANTSSNQAVFLGTYTGNLGYYQGGSGEDVVSMDEVAGDMDFFVKLFEGEDTFNLGNNTSVVYLFVNFGEDTDTFNDGFDGIYPFATNFWNLP